MKLIHFQVHSYHSLSSQRGAVVSIDAKVEVLADVNLTCSPNGNVIEKYPREMSSVREYLIFVLRSICFQVVAPA